MDINHFTNKDITGKTISVNAMKATGMIPDIVNFISIRDDIVGYNADYNTGSNDNSRVFEFVKPVKYSNGAMSVLLQDSTRPKLIAPFAKQGASYTLASNTVIGAYTVKVTSATGIVAGSIIGMISLGAVEEFFIAKVISVATNTLNLDRPINRIFIAGTDALTILTTDIRTTAGSISTPIIYNIVNFGTYAVDIKSISIVGTDNAAMYDTNFFGISELIYGIVLRKKGANGNYYDIMNIKKIADIRRFTSNVMFPSTLPAGQYTCQALINFSDTYGVITRLNYGEELQCVVQDDLTGITSLTVTALGHFTDENS